MIDFKEDISNKGFNPTSASSPKDKDTVKKEEIKEHFLACSKCHYKSKKEALLKKHMLTKHTDHSCKECEKKFQSLMELLKHVAKHHVNENGEVKDIKDKGEEVVQNEEDQEKDEIKDSNEGKSGIKSTENEEKIDNEEKDKSFVFSESQFFNEFL